MTAATELRMLASRGRLALKCRGYIAPEYYKFDGFLSPSNNLKFSDVPNGLKASLGFIVWERV